MNRVLTGVPELDTVLGGGIPPASLMVVAGAPGTGKTVVSQQICFANGTTERPALYYTTLSEPQSKLLEHLSGFAFFDPAAVGKRVHFQNLAGLGGDGSMTAAADEVVRRAFSETPSVVVVDSAKALHDATPAEDYRRILYEMASRVAHTDTVLILVGEYAIDDAASDSDFAVADVIITMANEPTGVFDERWLRVTKVRGSAYLAGRHPFRIGDEGLVVYPRLESTEIPSARRSETRCSTGIPGLDEMTNGGFPSSTVTLISGPSGSGKTLSSLHYIAGGIQRNEPCLIVSFQENRAQLTHKAAAFGWDFDAALEAGTLAVLEVRPIEIGLDSVAANVRATLEEFAPVRAVIEGLGDLQHAARGSDRFADYMWSFLNLFRSVGTTAIITSENVDFFGPTSDLARGLSFLMENVILIRYTEVESDIRRAFAVVKMRDSDHERSLVQCEIGSRGIEMKGKFAGMAGVLTGIPRSTQEKFGEFFGR